MSYSSRIALARVTVIAALVVIALQPAHAQKVPRPWDWKYDNEPLQYPDAPQPSIEWRTPAPAKMPTSIPPPEYDHPFNGEVIIIDTNDPAPCRNGDPTVGACTTPVESTGGKCVIRLAKRRVIEAWGVKVEDLIRHETAHCNGWPGSHPGERFE